MKCPRVHIHVEEQRGLPREFEPSAGPQRSGFVRQIMGQERSGAMRLQNK